MCCWMEWRFLRSTGWVPVCWQMFVITFTLALLDAFSAQDMGHELREYCQSDHFKPTCPPGEVVRMRTARYGRLKIGHCVAQNFGFIGQCDTDVLLRMDSLCSGRKSCDIRVDEDTLSERRPCHKDLKSYLEASYDCIPVIQPPVDKCNPYELKKVLLNQPSGYIASYLTNETGCGSAESPWIIQAQAGQRINISLWDFGVAVKDLLTTAHGKDGSKTPVCRVYATIREGRSGRSVTVCGGRARFHTLYFSEGSSVEVRVLNSKTPHTAVHFLLQYKVIGCADPPKPRDGWVNRNGNQATLGCDIGGETWHLVCGGDTWRGKGKNCTSPNPISFGEYVEQVTSLPHSLSIAIVFAIAIVIGIIILALGLFCIHKYVFSPRSHLSQATSDTERVPPVNAETPYDTAERKLMKAPVANSGQSPLSVSADLYSRGNEYASMKIGMTMDRRFAEDMNFNQSQEAFPAYPGLHCQRHSLHTVASEPQRMEHIYESPDSPAMAHKSHMSLDSQGPQYFDLDPDTGRRQSGNVNAHSAHQMPPQNRLS